MAAEESLVPLSEMEKGVGGRLEDVDLNIDHYSDVSGGPIFKTDARMLELPKANLSHLHYLGAGGFLD
jgi:hypothetical protein